MVAANIRDRTNKAAAAVLDPLAFKALSYGLAGLLALAAIVLSVVSLRIEIIYGKPVHGLFPVVLMISALCVFIVLVTAYVELQRPVSTLLRWERAAFTSRK
jgi:hypothetical protein